MLKRLPYPLYCVIIVITSAIVLFFYSLLQNDHFNIIVTFSAWSASQIQIGRTVAEFVSIPMLFLYGFLFHKLGTPKVLSGALLVCAFSCILIALSGGLIVTGGSGSLILFSVAAFLVRLAATGLQFGAVSMCVRWFGKLRGLFLGLAAVGSPLLSVVGVGGTVQFIQNTLDGDYRPYYVFLAVFLRFVAALPFLFVPNWPEDAGIWPEHHPILLRRGMADREPAGLGRVLKTPEAWLAVAALMAYGFVLNACMSSMALRFITLGGADGVMVWISATRWLSVGAVLALFMTPVYGVLCDFAGPRLTAILYGVLQSFLVFPLMVMPEGGSTALEIVWGIGIGFSLGGLAVIGATLIADIAGRRTFDLAFGLLTAITIIPSSFAAMIMAALLNRGVGGAAYIFALLFGLVGIAASVGLFVLQLVRRRRERQTENAPIN